MNKIILKKIIPKFILLKRRQYKNNKVRHKLNKLSQNIVNYLGNIPPQDMTDEKQAVLDYLKCHPLSAFPYSYTEKYNPEDVTVYLDAERKMCYILQDGKRLYFKKGWDKQQIQAYYNRLLMEQDALSPHRYETDEFHVSEGDVVVDAGVAEGNFALSVIEKVKKIYLFEVDKAWIAALEATFAPWKDKVVIVNKFVSDSDEGNCVTLDTFFGNEKVDFIKADIEGAELLLLRGMQTMLSKQTPIKIALCAYHNSDDAAVLSQMMSEKGFHTEFSKGYMIFYHEMYDKLEPPYLRRGLIRGIKR